MVGAGIERLQTLNRRFLGEDSIPEGLFPYADRRDRPDSSDNDAFQSVRWLALVGKTKPVLGLFLREQGQWHALVKRWGRGLGAYEDRL